MTVSKISSLTNSDYPYRVTEVELKSHKKKSVLCTNSLKEVASFFKFARKGKFTIALLQNESEYDKLLAMARNPINIGEGGFSYVQLMNIPQFFNEPQAAKITDPEKFKKPKAVREVTETEISNIQYIECVREKYLIKNGISRIEEFFLKERLLTNRPICLISEYFCNPFPFPKVSLIVVVCEKVFSPGASEVSLKKAVRFMEYMGGGDLCSAVGKKWFSINEASHVLRPLLRALEILHKNGFVHQDVTLSNGFIREDGGLREYSLGDLGLAEQLEKGVLNGNSGTYSYFAPEKLLGMSYDTSVDVWAIGVITFKLILGSVPFERRPFRELSKYSPENLLRVLYSMEKVLKQNMSELYFLCPNKNKALFTYDFQNEKIRLKKPSYEDIFKKGLEEEFDAQPYSGESRQASKEDSEHVQVRERYSEGVKKILQNETLRDRYTKKYLKTDLIYWNLISIEERFIKSRLRESPTSIRICIDFIKKCLTVNPKERLSVTELLNHPFIKEPDQLMFKDPGAAQLKRPLSVVKESCNLQ